MITCLVNGKQYCGLTSKTEIHRWQEHVNVATSGKGYALHAAIRKHGTQSFSIDVVASDLSLEHANVLEFEIIRDNALIENGYNCCEGGGHVAKTDIVRKKISDATKGRKLSAEHRLAFSFSRLGKHVSEEHRMKLSLQKRGDLNPAKRIEVKDRIKKTKREAMRKLHANVMQMHENHVSRDEIAETLLLSRSTVKCLIGAHNRGTCRCMTTI